MAFFSGKISISTAKISDDLFYSLIFSIFTVLNVLYDPFFTRKKHYFTKECLDDTFFTLFVFLRASDNTTSQNIGGGGRMHGPFPVVDGPAGTPGKIPVGRTAGAGDIWAARAASTLNKLANPREACSLKYTLVTSRPTWL